MTLQQGDAVVELEPASGEHLVADRSQRVQLSGRHTRQSLLPGLRESAHARPHQHPGDQRIRQDHVRARAGAAAGHPPPRDRRAGARPQLVGSVGRCVARPPDRVHRGDRWVVDSDYRRKVGTLVLERADTVVWLDLPCTSASAGCGAAPISDRGIGAALEREHESWWTALGGWDSLFVYAVRGHARSRRALPQLLAQPHLRHLRVVRLRSPEQVESWLSSVQP